MTTREEAKGILRARALALAREPVTPVAGDAINVIEFRLGGERYAIETMCLRDVQVLKDLTPLPCTPAFVRGIVSMRGRILTVIDLRTFFDLPQGGLHDLHQVLIAQAAGIEVGIMADNVVGNRSIRLSDLQPPLPTLTGIRAAYLKGVTADRLAVLDTGRILGDPRIIIKEEV